MQIHARNSSIYISMPPVLDRGNQLDIGLIVNIGLLMVGVVQIWQWFAK